MGALGGCGDGAIRGLGDTAGHPLPCSITVLYRVPLHVSPCQLDPCPGCTSLYHLGPYSGCLSPCCLQSPSWLQFPAPPLALCTGCGAHTGCGCLHQLCPRAGRASPHWLGPCTSSVPRGMQEPHSGSGDRGHPCKRQVLSSYEPRLMATQATREGKGMIASSSLPGCAGIHKAGSLSPGFRLPYLCVSILTQPLLGLLPMPHSGHRGVAPRRHGGAGARPFDLMPHRRGCSILVRPPQLFPSTQRTHKSWVPVPGAVGRVPSCWPLAPLISLSCFDLSCPGAGGASGAVLHHHPKFPTWRAQCHGSTFIFSAASPFCLQSGSLTG